MKQTAVEWLVGQLKKIKYNPLEKNGYSNAKERLFEKSRQMEKQQIINAYIEGSIYSDLNTIKIAEQYYNETFKKE